MTASPAFKKIDKEELPHNLQLSSCFSLCPSMALISFQLNDSVIWIYRHGNEKVWDIESSILKSDTRFLDIAWKPDGKMFAIALEDGLIGLFDSMTGNMIRSLALTAQISCLKWFKSSCRQTLRANYNSVNGLLNSINIINSLPSMKISEANLDAQINQKELDDDEMNIDILLAGTNDGKLSCVFSGIFIVDDLLLEDIKGSEISDIVANQSLSNQYLLVNKGNNTTLWKLNTEFILKGREFTKILLICSNLLNIIDNFKTSIKQINSHYKPYIDYTIRIIELLRGEIKDDENGKENIEGKGSNNEMDFPKDDNVVNDSNNADPVYDLYDLLLTGSLSNATKKWLTDYLSDRGMKRWAKLGHTYFDNARSSIYNDLVSSLHHLIVYLTDLKGFSQWHPTGSSIPVLDIEECIKISQNVLKYSYKFMMQLNDDQRYFEQAIIWLSSILAEITADEKINASFKTNDITKFLMFISSKLNSIDHSDVTDGKLCNNDSKLSDFTQVLDTVLNKLFLRIKDDIKSNFRLEASTLISENSTSDKFVTMKIHSEDMGYVYMLVGDHTLNIKKFDTDTLRVLSYTFQFNGHSKIVDMKMISNDKVLVLHVDTVHLYLLSYGNESLQEIGKYEFNCELGAEETGFQAGDLAVSEDQDCFCVLDSSRKKYVWIYY